MKTATKKIWAATLGLACVACCATPVLGLLTGLLGISALPLLAGTRDPLYLALMALPLLLGAVGYHLRRRKRNRCATTQAACKGGECGAR